MINFFVTHEPAPKGSKRGFINRKTGRVQLVEASDKCGPFVDAVAVTAAQNRPATPIDGPVVVSLTFTLKRPASAPKKVQHPFRKPDLDKLIRAVLDGLTAGGIWTDDARVVAITARKTFADVLGVAVSIAEVVE